MTAAEALVHSLLDSLIDLVRRYPGHDLQTILDDARYRLADDWGQRIDALIDADAVERELECNHGK